ncbi:MAG: response regulator, partial [Bacillus wiedmannii]|nr:response regulator [Bacillus wiedmannii]
MNKAVEVLIVEDDVRIAHIHRKFIERIEGFDIIGIAHSAEESFDWIESFQPDLVLLDVYFPDKLGTDILVFIKEKSPNTDVIFITAAAETEILKKAFRSGVVDYILKPLTFERFKQSLESYLEKRALLEQKDKLTEYEIEAIWRYSSGQVAVSSLTPKGIDPLTKDKIV